MIQCGDENHPKDPNGCWRVPGLPDKLEEGRLDDYSRDHDEYLGPRDQKDPPDVDRNNRRYKWRTRGVGVGQLIQLSFHDCLR